MQCIGKNRLICFFVKLLDLLLIIWYYYLVYIIEWRVPLGFRQ